MDITKNHKPKTGEIYIGGKGVETWEIIGYDFNGLIQAKSTRDGIFIWQYAEYFTKKVS